jgi:hypothetical protein
MQKKEEPCLRGALNAVLSAANQSARCGVTAGVLFRQLGDQVV